MKTKKQLNKKALIIVILIIQILSLFTSITNVFGVNVGDRPHIVARKSHFLYTPI
jgi:hypothetical protein